MSRPPIRADVAAALTAAIPPRLVKKLDATPALAEAWTWSPQTVTTDKGEVVSLALDGGVVTGVTCTCLLAPRCLHVAAVVALLEPAGDAVEAAPAPATPATMTADGDARAAAAGAHRTLADILATGAEASGAFVQAELLRAIHACRGAGLHRLATSQTRALRSIRDLRADRPEFRLAVLAADLREALAVADAIAAGEASPVLFGAARRDYEPIGNLELFGMFTEAVIARSGYAGATTYLVDGKGRFYTRADIAPGDAGRAAAAYDSAANIGDAVLPHRELCRSGLFVSDATASLDGRLGAGQRVRAVRANKPSSWALLDARFAEPLVEQLARIAARDGEPDEVRPAAWDLVFVEGTIAGTAIIAGETPLQLSPLEHRALATRDNLTVLARASGLRVRAIGRVRIGRPRELALLAIGPAPGEARFAMPEAWHGRANVHYDRLSNIALGPAVELPVVPAPPAEDLLTPLRRRVERAVLGGVGTLPPQAIGEVEREARLLADCALHGAAEVLRDLVQRPRDRATFARAWLRAAVYEDAARRRLSVASW